MDKLFIVEGKKSIREMPQIIMLWFEQKIIAMQKKQ